jgi:tetratricopeptide (TPR) repeat protein
VWPRLNSREIFCNSARMDLRERLFATVESGDIAGLEELCREHRSEIVDAFPAWQRVPEDMRTDELLLQRYATGLIAVARLFADRLGDTSLIERLGSSDQNPLAKWDAELQAASEEMEHLRYADAGRRLEHVLDETNGLRGSGADQLRPITLGFLGECMFQQGNADAALPFYELALDAVRAIGDASGIAAYLDSLYEVNRYLGRGEIAARYANELATLMAMAGRDDEARRLHRRAVLAKAGEPKNRVLATIDDGTSLELDEVTTFGGRIRFSFQRDRISLRRASALVEEGEQLGANGELDAALEKFREAAALDPQSAHARYQEGFTLCVLRRYDEAIEAYRTTERLAPGWFHCRADLWVAQQLAAGKIDHETFEALRELEDGPAEPAVKLALADATIAKAAHVPGLHLERGRQLARLGRPDEARSALRDGLARDPDPDIRTRLLVQLAIVTDEKAERIKLFEEAARVEGNLVAAATAKLALRQG